MMRTQRLRFGAVAVLAVFGLALAGCGVGTENPSAPNATAPTTETDWEVAGSMTADGPNGPRQGVPDAPLEAVNGDGGSTTSSRSIPSPTYRNSGPRRIPSTSLAASPR